MLNHRNAHFVLYIEHETGKLAAYLADTDHMQELKEEIADLGTPVSAHRLVFDGVEAISQRGLFDWLSQMVDLTEPNAMPTLLLASIFQLGVTVGAERERSKHIEAVLSTPGLPSAPRS